MNRSDALFRGFSHKQALNAYSPALHALRSLREDLSKKGENVGNELNIRAMPVQQLDMKKEIAKQEENLLPSRKNVFPSSYVRLTKWFYTILFFLFVGLLTGLLFWGHYKLGSVPH